MNSETIKAIILAKLSELSNADYDEIISKLADDEIIVVIAEIVLEQFPDSKSRSDLTYTIDWEKLGRPGGKKFYQFVGGKAKEILTRV
jgi:hypothetical protein